MSVLAAPVGIEAMRWGNVDRGLDQPLGHGALELEDEGEHGRHRDEQFLGNRAAGARGEVDRAGELRIFEDRLLFSIGDLNAAAALIAFTVAALLIAVSLPLAPRLGLVDLPQGRKDHAHPTPVVGGIAMLAASAVAMLFVPGETPSLWAFMAAACVIVVIGMGLLSRLLSYLAL